MRGRLARVVWTLAALALLLLAGAPAPVRGATTVLYDGAGTGQTPDQQGYFAFRTAPDPPAGTTATATSQGTILDSTGAVADYAGYFTPQSLPVLRRSDGYTVTFTAQLSDESHTVADRAGFSVLVLGDDRKGIELGFWRDEIWAQNDAAGGLFTHGEGAAFDTSRLVRYSLVVRGDSYWLYADGAQLLSGALRRYTPSAAEIFANPLLASYLVPNLMFLGDNTSKASAEVLLGSVQLETAPGTADPSPSPSPSTSPSPSASPSPETSPSPSPEPSPSPSPAPGTETPAESPTPRVWLPLVIGAGS